MTNCRMLFLCFAACFQLLFSNTHELYAGTPYATVVGNPPVCTSLAFHSWCSSLSNFRLAECPIARASTYYFSQSGADTNSGTFSSPFKSLTKAQSLLAGGANNIRLCFRRGDVWHEWAYVPYTGMTQGVTSVTQITISSPPTSAIYCGQTVTLNGGNTENATVMSYTPATGTILLLTTVALTHTALTANGFSYAIVSSNNINVSTMRFGTIPPSFFGGAPPGLTSGGYIIFPSSDGWQFIGNYNQSSGIVTMTTLLANSGQTSFMLAIPQNLVITGKNVTIDDYSDGTTGHRLTDQSPTFSAFGWTIPAGTLCGPLYYFYWKLTTSPLQTSGQVYEIGTTYGSALNGMIGAFRAVNDVNVAYRNVGSFAECDGTPGSWWQDLSAKKIYFHGFAGQSPNTGGSRSYEWAYCTGVSAIMVQDVDNVRIRNIRIEGYGLYQPGNQTLTGYAIQSTCSGTNSIVFDSVEAYYCNRHCLGNLSSSGGIATYYQCRTGWMSGDGGNIVTYAGAGGQESLSIECEAISGILPYDMYSPYGNNSAGGIGSGVFAHTNGGSEYVGLFLDINAKNRPGQWQVGSMNGPTGDSYPWTDLVNCRAFVVDEVFSAREPTPVDIAIPNAYNQGGPASGAGGLGGLGIIGSVSGGAYIAYINCTSTNRVVWDANPINPISASQIDIGGPWINGNITLDFIGAPCSNFSTARTLFPGSYSIPPYTNYYNCRIHFSNYSGSAYNAIYYSVPIGGADVFMNSILSTDAVGSPSAFTPNIGNLPPVQSNNCYSNATTLAGPGGYDQDPYFVETGDLPFGHPSSGSSLLSRNNQLLYGKYRLEYDADWQPRNVSTPAIGPYEPLAIPTQTQIPSLANASFETPSLASYSYLYNPTGGSWIFTGNSGVQSNGSAWGVPNAPDGAQTAFLQGYPNQVSTNGTGVLGSISQSVSFTTTGTYTLTFQAARRQGQIQPIKVSVDGVQVGALLTPSSNSFAPLTTASFTIGTTGNHTVTLSATNNSADLSTLIDQVSLVPSTVN